MTHEDAAARLDAYLDGTLDPAEKAEVEAHIVACPVCRDELMALQSILADARALPRSVMPARDLWTGIEGRLGPRRTALPFTQRYRAPLLAAAALVVLVGGVLIGKSLPTTPASDSAFALEQQRYTAATDALARQLSRNQALTDETRAVVERNLAIVDEAIREAEQALDADPGNTALEQMVLAGYEQRLALLKRATDAGRQES
jgi:anti-sigma factor ChrR (cupin superfamily)